MNDALDPSDLTDQGFANLMGRLGMRWDEQVFPDESGRPISVARINDTMIVSVVDEDDDRSVEVHVTGGASVPALVRRLRSGALDFDRLVEMSAP